MLCLSLGGCYLARVLPNSVLSCNAGDPGRTCDYSLKKGAVSFYSTPKSTVFHRFKKKSKRDNNNQVNDFWTKSKPSCDCTNITPSKFSVDAVTHLTVRNIIYTKHGPFPSVRTFGIIGKCFNLILSNLPVSIAKKDGPHLHPHGYTEGIWCLSQQWNMGFP